MATWARKATMRKNGHPMRNVTITFALGRYEAAVIVARNASYFGTVVGSRKALIQDIENHLYSKGKPTCEVIEDLPEEALEEAYATVDRLMPELKETN